MKAKKGYIPMMEEKDPPNLGAYLTSYTYFLTCVRLLVTRPISGMIIEAIVSRLGSLASLIGRGSQQ